MRQGAGKIKTKHIQTLFALIIFAVFSLAALMLSVSAVSSYRKVCADTEENSSLRSTLSYIKNKIKSAPDDSSVLINKIGGNDVLLIASVYGGEKYENCLYYYNGALYEQLIAENDELDLDNGNFITKIKSLSIKKENGSLYKVKAEAQSGSKAETYVFLEN